MRSVLIVAGEASGDAYGAALARELQGLTVEAVGGPRLAAAGATMVARSDRWSAIGIVHSLGVVPRVVGGFRAAKRRLAGEPGVFVPIDFGWVNVRLARFARERGWRVLYFVPPGSWRRDRQGRDLPAITDGVSTPFAWSAEILREMGADARWYGHPLKSLLKHVPAQRKGEGIAILPGSREAEIAANLPILAEATRGLDRPVEIALAPGTDPAAVLAGWRGPPATAVVGETTAALRRARAAVVCSGTATLEAALCGCPCVVVYQGTAALRREEKVLTRLGLWRRPRFVSLPNLLLDREVVPERLDPVDPAQVRRDLDALLADPGPQLAAFSELDAALGPDDAIERTALWVREFATLSPVRSSE